MPTELAFDALPEGDSSRLRPDPARVLRMRSRGARSPRARSWAARSRFAPSSPARTGSIYASTCRFGGSRRWTSTRMRSGRSSARVSAPSTSGSATAASGIAGSGTSAASGRSTCSTSARSTTRRLRALAGFAGTLWPHRTRLLIPPETAEDARARGLPPRRGEVGVPALGEDPPEPAPPGERVLRMGASARGDLERVRARLRALAGLRAARPGRALRQRGRSRTSRCSPTISCGTRSGWRRCASRPTTTCATELPMRPAAERLIAMAEGLARSPRVRRASGVRPSAGPRPTARHRLRSYLRSGPDPTARRAVRASVEPGRVEQALGRRA